MAVQVGRVAVAKRASLRAPQSTQERLGPPSRGFGSSSSHRPSWGFLGALMRLTHGCYALVYLKTIRIALVYLEGAMFA